MSDLYETLGVSRTAGSEEIKKAYRDAAFKYHPDRNQGDSASEEKFKNINEAYAVLSDTEKRSQYDRYGTAGSAPFTSEQGYNPFGQGSYDPFAEAFNQQSGRGYTYTYYGPFYNKRNGQKEESMTRKDAFMLLFRGLCTLLLGLIFFRYSLFLGIFGLVICISVIGNGLTSSIKAVRHLFSFHHSKG